MTANPAPAGETFDLGFEADDDFSPPPAAPWTDAAAPEAQVEAAAPVEEAPAEPMTSLEVEGDAEPPGAEARRDDEPAAVPAVEAPQVAEAVEDASADSSAAQAEPPQTEVQAPVEEAAAVLIEDAPALMLEAPPAQEDPLVEDEPAVRADPVVQGELLPGDLVDHAAFDDDPFADFPPAPSYDEAFYDDVPVYGFEGAYEAPATVALALPEPQAARPAPDIGQPPAVEPMPSNPVGDLIADVEQALGGGLNAVAELEADEPDVSGFGVPRITIHAFCERPATGDMIESAAADRRMARASTVVRMGGLAAAVEHYQGQPTPSLVLVESLDPAPVILRQLDALAQVCDADTKVVVLGQANDIALYRQLIKRGVSEYLVAPLRPLSLIRTITGLYADPDAPFAGRQIAFVGARGGVGASTLAHNFAYAMAERLGAGTVLADFDLAFGTAGLDFNQDPLQGVADALSEPDRLDPILLDRMMVRCTDRLSLLAAPANLDHDYDAGTEAYEEVARKVRGAAPYVVLDLPHAWSAWKRRMLVASDELIVVATPDLASLRNAKNIVDLARQGRPHDAPPRLVLNQTGLPGRPEIPVKDFAAALSLEPSLVLAFDAKLFGEAANNGQMVIEAAPKSKTAEGIEHLAALITRRAAPAPAKPASLLATLFKKKA